MVNRISFGWIDYSSEDRDKVMSVLHALSAPDAVDELGIGVIRDGFADILFPGTSTVQTRAKYFLIVPYILMELEKNRKLDKEKFLNKLDRIEKDLIGILDKNDAEGVIGRRAKDKLKRKPSSIYWNGLRTLGIFKYTRLTLSQYAKATCDLNTKSIDIKKGIVIDAESFDDNDASNGEIIGQFWRCINPNENWKNEISIDLSKSEAAYLVDRISKSPFTRETLFGYIIKNNLVQILETNDFEAIGELIELPEDIKNDYEMAKDFSEFIYGANIRYNSILYNGNNEEINEEWEQWKSSEFVRNRFNDYDVNEVIYRLNIRDCRLINFLNLWHKLFLIGDLDSIDELITKREENIKSKNRCKLNNPDNFNTDSNRIRGGKLNYRFTISNRLIRDIFNGLEVIDND